MKLVDSLSNPLINGSEWVYERFTSLLPLRGSRNRGRRHNVTRVHGTNDSADGRWFDQGCCDHRLLLAGSGLQVAQFSSQINTRHRSGRTTGSKQRASISSMNAVGKPLSSSSVTQLDDLLQELTLNPPKDLSAARRRQRDKAIAMMRDEALLEAAYGFNIVHLEEGIEGGRFQLGGESLPRPAKLPRKGRTTALGCCAYTLGESFETRVRALLGEKRAALALALDALGNELQQALGHRMRCALLEEVRRQKLILGQRLQFGESELDLPAQAALLRLSGAGEIGISLQRGNLLRPQRSNLAVFAVGPNLQKIALSRYRD